MHLSAIALVTLLAWGIPKDAMFGVRVTNLLDVPTYFKLRTLHDDLYRSYFVNLDFNYSPTSEENIYQMPSREEKTTRKRTTGDFELSVGVELMDVEPLKEFSKGVQLNFLSGFTPFLDFSADYSREEIDSSTTKNYIVDGALGLTGVWGVEATFKLFGKDMALQVLNSVFTVKTGYRYTSSVANYSDMTSKFITKTPYIDFTGIDLIAGELSVWLLVKL